MANFICLKFTITLYVFLYIIIIIWMKTSSHKVKGIKKNNNNKTQTQNCIAYDVLLYDRVQLSEIAWADYSDDGWQ